MNFPLSIVIPFPPSWNDRAAPRKPLTEAVKAMLHGQSLPRTHLYSIHIHVRHRWHDGGGRPVRRDVVNYAKVAEDAVMRALGCDDSHNFRLVMDKRESTTPSVHVVIREIGPIGQHPSLPPEGA